MPSRDFRVNRIRCTLRLPQSPLTPSPSSELFNTCSFGSLHHKARNTRQQGHHQDDIYTRMLHRGSRGRELSLWLTTTLGDIAGREAYDLRRPGPRLSISRRDEKWNGLLHAQVVHLERIPRRVAIGKPHGHLGVEGPVAVRKIDAGNIVDGAPFLREVIRDGWEGMSAHGQPASKATTALEQWAWRKTYFASATARNHTHRARRALGTSRSQVKGQPSRHSRTHH